MCVEDELQSLLGKVPQLLLKLVFVDGNLWKLPHSDSSQWDAWCRKKTSNPLDSAFFSASVRVCVRARESVCCGCVLQLSKKTQLTVFLPRRILSDMSQNSPHTHARMHTHARTHAQEVVKHDAGCARHSSSFFLQPASAATYLDRKIWLWERRLYLSSELKK